MVNMDKETFDNNVDLQAKFTNLVSEAVRGINTEPGLTPEQKKQLIKDLAGAPKHLMFEYLNSRFRDAMHISVTVPLLINKNRPRGIIGIPKSTTKEVLAKVKKINTFKKNR